MFTLKIIQLPDQLANKIAAGEVVERPVSVVKELIENSIDAKSTWIKVELTEAGLKRIKITDNGEGMSAEDCKRAFLRHATSKIKYEADLFHVKSLGFRGEALASIASVSRLTIKTSTGNEAGTLLYLEGGKVINEDKCDARQGTEISVEDLFFNTPARLKYMKTIYTELGHITDLLNRYSIAHPDIKFEAYHNGKRLLSTAGSGDLLQVIANVYGVSIAKKMLPVQQETIDYYIEGFISLPEVTRASRNFITIIVNGRYIKNQALTHAILRGYHSLLPLHRSPIVVLTITMDPILVDVNVHPTKLEVRFSKEKELIEAIETMIQSKLRRLTLIPEIDVSHHKRPEKSIQHSFQFKQTPRNEQHRQQERIENVHVKETHSPLRTDETTSSLSRTNKETTEFETETELANVPVTVDERKIGELFNEKSTVSDVERIPTMYVIGQLHGTYILAQNETGFYMIDQHAAQERIKYEFFKEKLGETANHVQELLIPLTFDFSKHETIFIETFKEELAKVGLFFEDFGEKSYAIRAYPNWFPEGFEEEIIREMVAQIVKDEKIDIKQLREEAAILMSCKRSIKANHYLTKDDMTRLLEDLRKTTDPFTCPHGRPVIIHFSTYEIEKMFKRIM